MEDYRNYKVKVDKAINVLSFKPNHDIKAIVNNLIENQDKFSDFSNPKYYNLEVFKSLENK